MTHVKPSASSGANTGSHPKSRGLSVIASRTGEQNGAQYSTPLPGQNVVRDVPALIVNPHQLASKDGATQ